MSLFLQIFYVFLSALCLALGIPNELYIFGSPFLGFIAFIPMYFLYFSFKSYKQAFFLTGLQTFLVHIFTSFWLGNFKDFAALTLGASAFGTGLEGAIIGLLFYLPTATFSYERKLYNTKGIQFYSLSSFKIFWFSAVYVIYEWIKSNGWLGYPWGTVSMAMYNLKRIKQIADITGTYGITFITVLIAAVIAEGFILLSNIEKKENRTFFAKNYINTAAVSLMLLLSTFIYGSYRYSQHRTPQKYLNTIIVQQNADPWAQENDTNTIRTSQKLTEEKLQELKAQNISVDFIVWSEGCLKNSFPNSLYHYKYFPHEEPLIPFIQKIGIPFLLGGPVTEQTAKKKNIFNGALLFDSEGNYRGFYPKNHLVPCAEVLPFADIPIIATFFKKVIGISAGWTPGDQYVLFDIQGQKANFPQKESVKIISLEETFQEQTQREKSNPYVRISTPICFGDAFPDVCNPLAKAGTELFVNITDDSWSKKKSAEYQHFVVASYRTIELRKTMVRSTNAGYSVVIDPVGNVLADMPLFEEKAIFFKVPVYSNIKTFYLKHGNWLPRLIALIIICFSIYCYIEYPKLSSDKSERNLFKKKKKSKRR